MNVIAVKAFALTQMTLAHRLVLKIDVIFEIILQYLLTISRCGEKDHFLVRSLEEGTLPILIIEGESPLLLAWVERLVGVLKRVIHRSSLSGDICCHCLVRSVDCCLHALSGLFHRHLVATRIVVLQI